MSDKEDLIDQIKETFGALPPNLRLIIKALSHPDVIASTLTYFHSQDFASMCTTYEAPWNCRREAEARYENIKFGWLGAAPGVGYEDWWCDNCRKKVMEQ